VICYELELFSILKGGKDMQSAIERNHVIIKLDNGEDLFEALARVIDKHGIESGLILSGIGMLRDLKIGFYNGTEYNKERFADPKELLSMHGSVASGQENRIHIHVGLANNEHKVFGGHLFSAKVCMLNEIVLLKLDEITLKRELNEKSGLLELKILEGK
jgi:predicted DNA-binding protein with PD1-like motif